MDRKAALYRTIWRWHFYAGLFVIPLILILSVTGGFYLFKPQVDGWEERAFRGLSAEAAVSPDAQVRAALAAFPGASFHSYRLPEAEGDAALVHVGLAGPDKAMRDVFVSPQGKVVGALDPKQRIMQIAHDIHGQLLLGHRGSWLVELAASWAIVMVITGLFLWWPRGRGMAGVVWPRLGQGSPTAWRDAHAVTGFWVSGLAMVLLLTGLPWADVWGSAFKAVRTEMGWIKGPQDWTIGGRAPDAGEHAEHDHAAMMAAGGKAAGMAGGMAGGMQHDMAGMVHVPLSTIVARAKSEHLPFPVILTPPGGKQRFGKKAVMAWTARSDTQNRPERVTITYDAMSGQETQREVFADKHVIDRVVGYGVAWHEGALFGLVNQLIGVATALALVLLAVSGFVMWRRRKPEDALGALPPPQLAGRGAGLTLLILALALFLPLFAISLLALWLIDRLVLPRTPGLARWMGLPAG